MNGPKNGEEGPAPLGGGLLQVSDEVGPLLGLLEPGEYHLGPRDILLGVLEVLVQGLLVPRHAAVLIRIAVREPFHGPRCPSEEPSQVRPLRPHFGMSRWLTLMPFSARACLFPPPFCATWHWAHFVLKIFSPAQAPPNARASAHEQLRIRETQEVMRRPHLAWNPLPELRPSSPWRVQLGGNRMKCDIIGSARLPCLCPIPAKERRGAGGIEMGSWPERLSEEQGQCAFCSDAWNAFCLSSMTLLLCARTQVRRRMEQFVGWCARARKKQHQRSKTTGRIDPSATLPPQEKRTHRRQSTHKLLKGSPSEKATSPFPCSRGGNAALRER